ncbi:MAG TPA: hypothetical protein VJ742_09895, partial [Nitrososphaera sp.]|nr:hypothetical protein [Nitrososphaera sp.]
EWCGKLSATTSYRKPNNQVVFDASTRSFLPCKPAVFWSDPAICLDLLSFQETPSSTASTISLKIISNPRIIPFLELIYATVRFGKDQQIHSFPSKKQQGGI